MVSRCRGRSKALEGADHGIVFQQLHQSIPKVRRGRHGRRFFHLGRHQGFHCNFKQRSIDHQPSQQLIKDAR